MKNSFFLLPILILAFGCSTSIERKIEYINTPVYCNVDLPTPPYLKEGTQYIIENFKKVLVYKDQLEMALYCCKGDSRCIIKQ